MSDTPPKAVFLSYAREDADTARRIAEALRAFGVEAWFDMSELRGGDAWDQKIRRQIKECALFIPLISAQSEQRGEGYFRLEWKLAVERTHLLADGMPFLFPVVIDETEEGSASVPEQFLKAQWTRLADGEPTPQFVEQVKRLLQGPRRQTGSTRPPTRAPVATHPPVAPKSGFPVWAIAVIAIVVLGAGAFFAFRPHNAAPVPAPAVAAPSAPVPAPVAAAPVNDKSLAVLPFTNMSEEKDSAFFTDGIQEDILTNLALISELHVVSRTSVMQYRNTTKSIRQIAQELGVTYILEGSVRRAGNKVRVTGQLIRAATDEHVWAKAYDRELNDIFAIQESLSSEIANALQAAITPAQKNLMAERTATNVDAYSDYLKAREIITWSGIDRGTIQEIDRLLRTAVQRDPNYSLAWVETAKANFRAYRQPGFAGDHSRLEAGLAALANAVRLSPNDPATIVAQGFAAEAQDRMADAKACFEKALQIAPNDSEAQINLGYLLANTHNWRECMLHLAKARELDPRNPQVIWSTFDALMSLRRFDEASGVARSLVELQPDSFDAANALARIPFYAHGSTAEVDALFGRLTPAQLADGKVIATKLDWYYHGVGDAQAYIDLHDRSGTDNNFSEDDSTIQYAEALISLGQRERAVAIVRPLVEPLKRKSAADPDNYGLLESLGYAEAISGDSAAAVATANRALAMLKPDSTLLKQFNIQTNAAIILAWANEKDRAVEIFETFRSVPVGRFFNTESMKHDVDMFPLRGFPRWEALLADPAANAPLSF
ncbi:MAG TPA: TIR domain-containing protein [Candidatus Didemnitutus sp.]|nr:TIR domain-containing protein [Candidatus Didemnitutus sp.]